MAVSASIDLERNEQREALAHLPDDALYALLVAGNSEALRTLFDRHVRAMRHLAMSVLRDAQESEDVTQEVFAALWRNRSAWNAGHAKFSTWLSRVTINRAIDHRRKLRATPREPVQITALSDARAVCSERQQDDVLDARRLTAIVQLMLDDLPVAQKSAIRAFYFEELSVEEISARMQLSQQAVRALLKRAKRGIRGQLARRRSFGRDVD